MARSPMRRVGRASWLGTEFNIQPDKLHDVFAADLSDEEAEVLAASQRPAAEVAFGEPLAVEPAWKTIPSWFVVAGNDHAINPDAERAAAERMGATMIQIDGGSHSIALSQSQRVSEVIMDAVAAVGAS
jgi:pimeloyl-ACP methyl ester carboxylesterase